MLWNREKFITVLFACDFFKKSKRCLNVPIYVETAEFLVSIMIFIMFAIYGSVDENSDTILLSSIIAGGGCFLLGLLLGCLYWCKVKEPFIANRFRKEYERDVYGGKSFFEKPTYVYEGATVFLFAGTFFSIGNLLGIN